MICNHIVVPLLVRAGALDPLRSDANFSRALLNIRRASIVVVLLLGYFYLQLSEDTAALASIGLISFAGAAQLLPAMSWACFGVVRRQMLRLLRSWSAQSFGLTPYCSPLSNAGRSLGFTVRSRAFWAWLSEP